MKDYSKVEENKYGKCYYNEKNQWHRITGPAVEWYNGDETYYINDIWYMYFNKNYNKLFIYKY